MWYRISLDRRSVVTVATSLYPVLYIAVVAAELSISVPVGSEPVPAFGTNETVHSRFRGKVWVFLPPKFPTLIRAKSAFLRFAGLDDFSAALRAAAFFVRNRHRRGYIVSFAEGFHSVVREFHYLSDLLIPIPLRTQSGNLIFLLIGHYGVLLLRASLNDPSGQEH